MNDTMQTEEQRRAISDHDIQLAEMWRNQATALLTQAYAAGVNPWSARAIEQVSRMLSEAALAQDHGEGIARRSAIETEHA